VRRTIRDAGPRASAGRFKPGPDPRRHVFTRAERRRGYRVAMKNADPYTVALVFRRVRGFYRARRRAENA
jgi:hypothetical protein